MILTSAFVTMLVAGVAVAAPAKRYAVQSDAEHRACFSEAHELASLAEKVERLSRPFVGTSYAFSPLGEGSGIDPDPRLRWDQVDCLTFVETSIALTEAPTFDQLLPVLDDIRYATVPPAFNRRNHFVESQWVPNNVTKGYIRSIARDIAGDATLTVTKAFGPELWRKDRHPDGLQLEPQDIPSGTFSLDVVPLAVCEKNSASESRTERSLMVVRPDHGRRSFDAGQSCRVRGGEGRENATFGTLGRGALGRVIDEPLDKFFSRNAAYATKSRFGRLTARPAIGRLREFSTG